MCQVFSVSTKWKHYLYLYESRRIDMNFLKKFFNELLEDIFVNMTNRLCVQLRLFCIAGAGISVIMTLLNAVKMEYRLGLETGVSAIVCIVIYLYTAKTGRYLAGSLCMAIILLAMFTLYVTGGLVEGFAALWFCLYPFICFFILQMKPAILFSGIGLSVLILFLWTPLNHILPPVYTQNFLLRFPFLYIGNFVFSLALNGFYVYTYGRLQQLNQKFEYLSNQDGLTKLSNRTYLERYKQKLMESRNAELHALMLDVDCFKQYNDNYGHMAGDEVLKSVAGVINGLTADPDSIAVRYGGEEFLILLQEAGQKEAETFARTLLRKIHDLKIPHITGDGYVSVSIGISRQYVSSEEKFLDLLKQADEALYCAKQSGRNCIITESGARLSI